MLIAHVEQDGVWRVKGGMVKVAQALEALARSLGVAFAFDTHVAEITCAKGRVTGIVQDDGQHLPADAIVFNGDVSALGQGLLGRAVATAAKPVPPPKRSQSALTWCVSARTSGMALAHHNVFFSNDYRAEFDDVFHARTLPVAPSIYVCAQDRGDACQSTANECERLLVLINAPPDGDRHQMTQAEIDRAQKGAWDMMAACGLEIEAAAEVSTAPHDFDALFPGSGGALYGLANHGMWASFQRPGARSAIKGLYLAGGTTHPGPGIPMATLSGRRAAESIMQDYGD
jgi:1-hydroxycarotenoid 3,4-desaturase